MNYSGICRKLLALAALAVIATGCATHIPVAKEVGTLNLNYQPSESSPLVGKSVGIVSPQFVAAEGGEDKSFGFQQNSIFIPQQVYQTSYKSRLADSMMNAIQEIISRKGFTIKGPYATFDDISFGDKKTIYLAAVPSLKIYFDAKRENVSCKGMVCVDKGSFTVTGEFIYKMVEPMTGQAVMTKRINLSDFAITKTYVREFQTRTQSEGLIGAALDKALNPDQLRDNTDKAMTEAVNEFFAKAMKKIDGFVSTEELMSFDEDIKQLKGLKRF